MRNYAGYITRYWHYLTGESSREIYAQCNENERLESYGFHSEASELAVADMKALARANGSTTHKMLQMPVVDRVEGYGKILVN